MHLYLFTFRIRVRVNSPPAAGGVIADTLGAHIIGVKHVLSS